MFDVIDFLEKVGQDAQWRHASHDEVGLALSGAEVGAELRVAILARDGQELRALLGQDPFCCYINPSKEDDGEGDDGDEDKNDKDDNGEVQNEPSKGPEE